jgi:hypothetical protein
VACPSCGGGGRGCTVCGESGLLRCSAYSGSGQIGTFKFEVYGHDAGDVERVATAFIDKGFAHMASKTKAEAILAGYQFEREVAAIYRALGARVEVDVGLAGSQIDVLVREQTPSGSEVTMAVECKSSQRPVGIEAIVLFASVAQLLRHRGLINRATVVARSGFTRQAREAASEYSLELLELADLEQRAKGKQDAIDVAEREFAKEQSTPDRDRPKRVFVVMPFSKEFEDVYLLGIREVAENLGFTVERADDIEHSESILDVIRARIRAADAVVGDTTGSNPNVFYEIGYAHALESPTILIARKGSNLPFDLRSVNHIMYETIVELRERLKKRLSALLREA